jgi:hypothetical protein
VCSFFFPFNLNKILGGFMQKTLEPKEMEIGGSEYFATKAGQNATASEFPCHTDAVASSLSSPASTRWLNNGETGEFN